jgi:hypothetical protein
MRPYLNGVSTIDDSTAQSLIIKVGRSNNLKARVKQYMTYGYAENEIACIQMPEGIIPAAYESYFIHLFAHMNIIDKHYGREWFVVKNPATISCLKNDDDLDKEKQIVKDLYQTMIDSSQGNLIPLFRFAFLHGLRMPFMLISKQSICSFLGFEAHSLQQVYEHFMGCISNLWMKETWPEYAHVDWALELMCAHGYLGYDENKGGYYVKKHAHDYSHVLYLSHHFQDL